jgi:putative oxidoreductase
MTVGKTATRVLVGGLFIGHGTQKLFGWFGGNPEGTAQGFESMGLRPGKRHAIAAGAAEAGGGLMLMLGALTPLATAALSGVMLTAIRKVHLKNGPWSTNGGYEYNLVLLALLMGLADDGPGKLSMDAAVGIERAGFRWALAELAAGAAGSQLAIEMGRHQPEPAIVAPVERPAQTHHAQAA